MPPTPTWCSSAICWETAIQPPSRKREIGASRRCRCEDLALQHLALAPGGRAMIHTRLPPSVEKAALEGLHARDAG